jgi:broad specificity phosphatase PhoE
VKMIFFVRHGRTKWNDEHRIQGCAPTGLTTEGRKQIENLLSCFYSFEPDAVYSSPVVRAMESACILAHPFSLQVIQLAGLTELDVGEWFGKTGEELSHDRIWLEHRKNPLVVTPPSGEGIRDLSSRVVRAVEHILGASSERVIVVTHADVIRAAVCHYLGFPLSCFYSLGIGLGSMSVISWNEEKVELVLLNYPLSFEGGAEST